MIDNRVADLLRLKAVRYMFARFVGSLALIIYIARARARHSHTCLRAMNIHSRARATYVNKKCLVALARARELHTRLRASDIYHTLWCAIAFTTTDCGIGFSTVFSLDGPTFWEPNGGHEQ